MFTEFAHVNSVEERIVVEVVKRLHLTIKSHVSCPDSFVDVVADNLEGRIGHGRIEFTRRYI